MPIINDGVYKIFNVQYATQVADLVTGGPGPIDGITDWNAHNDKWIVKNLYQGEDSNQITLESAQAPPGIYAYADQAQGAPVIGSPNQPPIIWTVVKVDGEPGKYRVFIWQLPAENTNVLISILPHPDTADSHSSQIVLSPYPPTSEANKTKWTFVSA
ncbi:hypothetical protein HD554DRAFT_2037270 [Boletus coccyginus]|nr:hypothetical protein HD554DRAFT_2037270 [Boletus coccyginus]